MEPVTGCTIWRALTMQLTTSAGRFNEASFDIYRFFASTFHQMCRQYVAATVLKSNPHDIILAIGCHDPHRLRQPKTPKLLWCYKTQTRKVLDTRTGKLKSEILKAEVKYVSVENAGPWKTTASIPRTSVGLQCSVECVSCQLGLSTVDLTDSLSVIRINFTSDGFAWRKGNCKICHKLTEWLGGNSACIQLMTSRLWDI